MSKNNAHFDYSRKEYQIIFQNTSNTDEYFGLDELESKKLKIIQAKYGCRHNFHSLPDHVSLNLHRFTWNDRANSFEVEEYKTLVQLNMLEEAIIEYFPGDAAFE